MPKPYTTYTEEKLLLACQAVNNGMSLRKAATTFNVPKTTIHSRLHKEGPPLIKGKHIYRMEQRLVHWYVYCIQAGFFNIHNRRLIREAKIVLKEQLSQGKIFDKDWCQDFIARHITIQDAIRLSPSSKFNTGSAMELWFKAIETFCREHNMLECLKQPQQMLYCCKIQLTEKVKVMLTYSLQDMITSPVLVQENLNQIDMEAAEDFNTDCDLPKNWIKYNCLEDDENDADMYYLQHVLDAHLKKNNISYPILLFMDFQNWPLSLKLYEFCCKLNIFIINSYPTAFRYTRDFQRHLMSEIQNSPKKNLNSYIEILKNNITTHLTRKNMYLNFVESGIFPFDVANANFAAKKRLDLKVEQVDAVAVQHIQPTIIPAQVQVSPNIFPEYPETARQPDIVLSFNEFQSIIGPDTLNKLQMSFRLGQESNNLEFNALLTIYRKFYASNDDVEVINEPLMEDYSDIEYYQPHHDINELHEM